SQLGPRLEAELVAEHPVCAPVGGQRVGLAAAAVEREHQLRVQPLAQWVLRDERIEVRHELGVPCECEPGLDALLDRAQAQLLESCDLRLRERLVCDVSERYSAPERECARERLRGCSGIVRSELAPAALDQPFEGIEVELALFDREDVAGSL